MNIHFHPYFRRSDFPQIPKIPNKMPSSSSSASYLCLFLFLLYHLAFYLPFSLHAFHLFPLSKSWLKSINLLISLRQNIQIGRALGKNQKNSGDDERQPSKEQQIESTSWGTRCRKRKRRDGSRIATSPRRSKYIILYF
ncbi:hypothetical protein LINGRAHAP2_LOCUS15239 [Linum grandiflorum]